MARRRSRYSPTSDEQIIRLSAAGIEDRVIGELLGRTEIAIKRRRAALGHTKAKGRPASSPRTLGVLKRKNAQAYWESDARIGSARLKAALIRAAIRRGDRLSAEPETVVD